MRGYRVGSSAHDAIATRRVIVASADSAIWRSIAPCQPNSSVRTLTERVVEDVGGAFTVGLAYLGDKLGLFAALAAHAPSTSADLARRAGLDERYVREWLNAMVAARLHRASARTARPTR